MKQNYFIKQLVQRFEHQPYISREELYDFYRSFEPDLKKATFSWRIHSLKEKNLLRKVRNGVYILSAKPQFHPEIETKLKDIAMKISKQFPVARYCVWNTRWLNEWMIHQPGKFLLMIEIELSAVESVFNFLKDENYKNVFFKPDENLIERYIYEENESIIIKPLVTKSPLQKEKKISIPSLEKILVDLFVEWKIFAPFQGSELIQIYNNLDKLFDLNITKLLAYAKRRAKEPELRDFITKNTKLKERLSE